MSNTSETRQAQSEIEASLLMSALELTANKDYVSLTKSFIQFLHRVPVFLIARVYEVHGRDSFKVDSPKTETLILKEVINILNKPFPVEEGIKNFPRKSRLDQSLSEKTNDGLIQITFPIETDSPLERILVIKSLPLSEDHQRIVLFALKIYGNLLTIIDDKDRDRLTGLLNRHTFDNQLSHIIEFSQQQATLDRGKSQQTSWLAILDIDHFKKVNDEFGHMAGDEVLLLFSRIMDECFRYTDILFRYGGEEFVVILNNSSRDGATFALERFREAVESFLFPKVGRVTVSIGFIQLYADNTPGALIEEADKALYHAKNTGRNRVISYLDLLEETGEMGSILLPA